MKLTEIVRFRRCFVMLLALCLGLAGALPAVAREWSERELERGFTETVHPFLENYCFNCHGKDKQKGNLDLRPYSTRQSVAESFRQWDVVLEKLKAAEMPPEEAKRQPDTVLRQGVIDWIQATRQHEARRTAGDPGPVLAHRLSVAEYNHTIRDMTGMDIQPAREFPVDPANEAGFDNSGESLAMSPGLLNKYLEAARRVSEHLVLKPEGFVFAPHPAVTETDRDRYCVQRIIDFYQRQPTNHADYFLAAWCFQHRTALRKPRASLTDFAVAARVSPKYLNSIWALLTDRKDEAGPIATLRALWRELPTPKGDQPDLARAGCERMRDVAMALRQELRPEVKNLRVRGIAEGSQPLVLWKDRQMAANRQHFDPSVLVSLSQAKKDSGADTGATIDPALVSPPDEPAHTRHQAALARFCDIFPDAFYISERVLVFLEEDKDSRGRLLSAGFHLMTGYFRDDAPLAALVLDDPARRELDKLWEEFHFITLDQARQYKDFIFFERAEPPRFMTGAEFDFARSEDKDATTEHKINQLAVAYLAKARRNGGQGAALVAIEDYFKSISANIRQVEQSRLTAEPAHLRSLLAFAARAYRRPLSPAERDDLLAFYRGLREQDGLDHEEAMRDTVASVLMSPYFCYRAAPALATGPTKDAPAPAAPKWQARPLSDHALASRLSYFLWASMPDAELLARAEAGDLHRPRVLVAQARRMLQDERARGLATEFGANWLDFRRFEEHNAVDRERFKTFNDELRAAMFEEPVRFFLDVVRRNRSVLDFLDADDTVVNPVLARHYGMPEPATGSNDWTRIDHASQYGRGGLLPMSVFLTKNAPGLRTSPVKRGYWVVRRLLGEVIPPPPPKVPELPSDEQKLGDLTLRETLARHRADPNCAGCHARFDAVGLVFEGYGPVGERRANDLAGRPVDASATFPGGSHGDGLEGLRRYLREHRQRDFLDNLCRKLLAYALGRSLQLSDEATIDNMRANLAANGYRFRGLVETIVTSPQFLQRREYDNLAGR